MGTGDVAGGLLFETCVEIEGSAQHDDLRF